jgi:Ankyrin repeats (3 copies)
MMQVMQSDMRRGFPRPWLVAGYVFCALAALFVGRVVYEETVLTWKNGPQMVGFTMAHASVPWILIAGIIGVSCGMIWTFVSIIQLFRRKFRVSPFDWLAIGLFCFLVVLLIIPYAAWEELLARTVGPGPYGGQFLVEAAAQNDRRFVELLLKKGYDINFETGGTTPLSGASVGGHEEMVKFLITKGADLNRKDGISGESPLMSAAEMGQLGTLKVLLDGGANPCANDKEGHTAEGLARKYNHIDIAQYLADRFHCKENAAVLPCVDSSYSACVH